MKLNKKRNRLQKISSTMKKFINSKYTTKEKILESRLKELKEKASDSHINKENYLDKLNGLEPIFHIYENYFVAFDSLKLQYGIVDVVREEIVVPCNYSEIYSNEKRGEVLISLIECSGIKNTYKASEIKNAFKYATSSKSEMIKDIANRNNFSTAVDISKSKEAI